MQPESTPPPASAGPRVSDETLADYMPVSDDTIQHIIEYGRGIEKDVAFDLQSARTALAAANARIAVLEARDVLVQALSVPLGKLVNTHGRVQTLWDASLESGELDEGDFDTAMNDLNLAVDEMYEGCYETVHARRPERLATASPEPGAAHE